VAELQIDLGRIFQPYEHQARLLGSGSRYLLFLAGIGAGKTHTGSIWTVIQSVVRNPGQPGLVAGRTEQKDAMLLLAKMVVARFDDIKKATGYDYIRRFNRNDNVLELVNGSLIYFRGFNQPDKMRGPEYAWAWLDELFFGAVDDAYVHELVDGRLRIANTHQQLLVTCSPKGLAPTIRRFVEAQRRADPRYYVVRASSWDNPHLDRDTVQGWLDNMSRRRARQEIYGDILRPEHVVFPEVEMTGSRHFTDFDWRKHQHWPWVLGVDWGNVTGHVALDIRVDPQSKRWVVADQLCPSEDDFPGQKASDRKFRQMLKAWVALRDRPPVVAGVDRAKPNENHWLQALLQRTAVTSLESRNEQRIISGLELLRDALDPSDSEIPRLRFSRSLPRKVLDRRNPGLIPSLQSFRYTTDRYGSPNYRRVFDDENKHAVDALRYAYSACRLRPDLHERLPSMVGLDNDGNVQGNRISEHRPHW